ncbi:MAG: acid-resistance rane protein [Actinoallomurus sp.]|jgi:uncharacterized membrane protein HdeD (DUF308 family)|nr:acid-resistance rane protein [Actinoallomurus sp.]
MLEYLARYWWVLAARGGSAIAFGTMVLAWPAATALSLSILFGLYALTDGILAAYAAFQAPPDTRPALVTEAVLGTVFGIVSLGWPSPTVLVITVLVGLWGIITGAAEIAIAIRVRKEIGGEFMYFLFGVFSILFGLIVLFSPVHGPIALGWLIGVCAVVYGIFMAAAAARLKVLVTGAPPPG